MAKKEVKLPKYIDYDLEGYRGFGVVRFPLAIREINGKWVGSYAYDKAEYALAAAWGDTRKEVEDELLRQLKMDRLLSQKMGELGYKWDVGKKELKKIRQ